MEGITEEKNYYSGKELLFSIIYDRCIAISKSAAITVTELVRNNTMKLTQFHYNG